MKIGYLVPEFPGQTHIFFWREIEALKKCGVDVDLISTRRPPQGIVSHVWSEEASAATTYLAEFKGSALSETVRGSLRAGVSGWARAIRSFFRADGIPFAQRTNLAAFAVMGARLSQLSRDRNWTHVHVHSCANAAQIAMFANQLSALRYSLTLHGPLVHYGPNQREKWRFASFAIVITKRLFGEVQRDLAGALPKLAIAPMGVDVATLVRSTPYTPWDGTGELRIFSCGRLHVSKGHADLIAAVAELRASGIDARAEIAGQDEQGGTGYRLELEKLLPTDGSVKLLGAVSEVDVRQRLQDAHVFVLASIEEPLGVAIMEAMAMAVPLVATAAGGVPELVTSGSDGLLVAPCSPSEIAAAVQTIVRQPALAMALSAAARTKVNQFDSGVSARAIAAMLGVVSAPQSRTT